MLKVYDYADRVDVGRYYADMPNEDYHAHYSISKSGLDVINRDPYIFFNQKPMVQTRPMQVGSAIHAAILEPDVFKDEYMMLPEVSDRRQPEYKQAVKTYGVEKVFTASDCENITNMQKAVWGNNEAARLLNGEGFFEVSGFAADPQTGIICRHRFDKLYQSSTEVLGVDVKKCQDVSEFKFSKHIADYRYHVQAAFYSDQYEWITGKKLDGFKFICVEEKWPHRVAVYELDDFSIEIGRKEYRANLDLYAHWMSQETKPQNNEPSKVISLPEWILREHEEDVL